VLNSLKLGDFADLRELFRYYGEFFSVFGRTGNFAATLETAHLAQPRRTISVGAVDLRRGGLLDSFRSILRSLLASSEV
jgi:hypothetical protein